MSTRTGPGRWTPGYTLDDAVRVRRRLAADEAPSCPTCGGSMGATVGRDAGGSVWIVRCTSCGASVVLHEAAAPGDAAARA